MMPDLSCHHPRISGIALSMGTKRKRSGSLGLAEPFHRNFTEYTKLYTFFTQKIGFWKFIRWLRNCSRGIGGLPGRLQQKRPAAILAAGPEELSGVESAP
jgi:hypothetical protein